MIVANLASFPPREAQLRGAVAALAPQVDRLNVVLNEYAAVPAWLGDYPQAVPLIPEVDTKDTGKFLPRADDDAIVLTVDDDIAYPPDYVARTLDAFRALQSDAVVGGYHGSIYRPARFLPSPRLRRILRFRPDYIVSSRRVLHFEEALDTPTIVDQLGTGVMVMRGADMPPFARMRDARRFADIRMARWCHERGLTMVCLPRPAGWLRPVEVASSIYEDFTRHNHDHLAREIESFAFKTPACGQPFTPARARTT